MAGNSSEIRVAGSGRIFVAAAGTALPTAFTGKPDTDWGANWKDLGYSTADGVTFSKKDKLEPIDSWQAVSPVHFTYSDRDLTLKFSLLQFNELTLPFFMGGGAVADEATPSNGIYRYDIADSPKSDARALGLEFSDTKASDGSVVTYRFYIPRGQVTASDDIKLARKAASTLGITFTALHSGDDKPLASFVMKDSAYAAG